MNCSGTCRSISGRSISAIFSVFAVFFSALQAAPCKAGKRPLYFFADSSCSKVLPESFLARLYTQMVEPLDQIGYCIAEYSNAVAADTTVQEEMVMWFSMVPIITEKTVVIPLKPDSSSDTTGSVEALVADTTMQMVVALLQVGAMENRERGSGAATSPLLTVTYQNDELSTFESVLIRKIIENMRDQYICHLRIESEPDGVAIRTNEGLEGITPLEWIIPVGKVKVTGELEGYDPLRRTIDLSEPGSHIYRFTMGRRRFFNSPFFVSSLALGATSAVCFGIDQFYYDKYRKLGRAERDTRPELFEEHFTMAKNFERAAGVAGALAGLSFVFSFIF